jgi:hypothetical protein
MTRNKLRGAAAMGLSLGAIATFAALSREESRAKIPTGTPVVVELFSSEGCSSCPPADAFLKDLDATQPISGVAVLGLEFHVDYWDDLGWKDPFANPEYSNRQRQYSVAFHDRSVFTPELVVEGHQVFSNGDSAELKTFVAGAAKRPRAAVTLTRGSSGIDVNVRDVPKGTPGDSAELWLAVTESGLSTRVEAGENNGRTLAHAPVVRSFVKVGDVTGAVFAAHIAETAATLSAGGIRFVALVQERGSRRILGAGAG